MLVAGEAELDEPLAVEVLRHLLQNLDPPQVVLDQVVVGRENRRDFQLRRGGAASISNMITDVSLLEGQNHVTCLEQR